MDVSPGGRLLAVAHSDNFVRFYHPKTYVYIQKINAGNPINAIRFSNDGNYFAVGTTSATINVYYGYQNFTIAKVLTSTLGGNINGLDWFKDSSKMVVCGGASGSGEVGYFTVGPLNVTWN